jgi:hypothetical protein
LALAVTGAGVLRLGDRIPDPLLETPRAPRPGALETFLTGPPVAKQDRRDVAAEL